MCICYSEGASRLLLDQGVTVPLRSVKKEMRSLNVRMFLFEHDLLSRVLFLCLGFTLRLLYLRVLILYSFFSSIP